jgi:hypothetical protein
MNDLLDVLRFLGYDEVRTAGGEWKPVSDVNGRLDGASTDDVHVIVNGRWSPSCRLKDPDTGQRIAVARQPDSEAAEPEKT